MWLLFAEFNSYLQFWRAELLHLAPDSIEIVISDLYQLCLGARVRLDQGCLVEPRE